MNMDVKEQLEQTDAPSATNDKKTKIKRDLADFAIMTAGVVIMTLGVYFFKIPNGFSTGGVSGVGVLLGKITSISPATFISVINVFLLLIGFIFLGKETGVRTVYCSLMFSLLTLVFERFIPLETTLSNQPFLELVYAILLTGVGSAMMFNVDATSGGTDIIALIMKKYTRLDVGKALLCSDSIIAISAFFVFDMKTGLYSVLGLFAKAFLVDEMIDKFNSCKYFIIITSRPEKMVDYIMENLHHGATVGEALGQYTGEKKFMVHTVCKRMESIKLRRYVKSVDPGSFVIITTSSEIIGRGFRAV